MKANIKENDTAKPRHDRVIPPVGMIEFMWTVSLGLYIPRRFDFAGSYTRNFSEPGFELPDQEVAIEWRIAAVGLDMLEAAFEAGLSPDADHDAETSQTFLQ
jgi:hypothetical protein